MKALERENKELCKANEILKLASAFFAQEELDCRLKSWRSSSISIDRPTGSSRSAKCCRSPPQATGAMPHSNAIPPSDVSAISVTTF